jgi:hypothetical protein
MTNTTWIVGFCNGYASKALWLAELFIYLGLVMGLIMAAAEAYKLFREAAAVKSAGAPAAAAESTSAVGEVIKSLAGILTNAKAWLALVIVGVILLWLAGNSVPSFCTSEQGTGTRGGTAAAAARG